MKQDLINYINGEKKKGLPDEVIADLLMTRGGWSLQEVQDAFRHLNQSQGPKKARLLKKKK